jgi:uracil-DNA glycosylase
MTYSGPSHPKMLLIGEAWGADEDRLRLPLVGVSGQENWRLLGEAVPIRPDLHSYAAELCGPRFGLAWVKRRDEWLEAASVGFTNVLNERPPNNDLERFCGTKAEVGPGYPYPALVKGKYLLPKHFHHLDRLRNEIRDLRPSICVLLGNTACWALLNTTGITSIRGTTAWSESFSVKCLPTFHPASLLYEGMWSRRPILISDYIKAYRESSFPEIRRPKRRIFLKPSLDDVANWIGTVLNSPPQFLAVDCETSGGIIDTIGFSPDAGEAFVIPFGPHRLKRGTGYLVVYPERDGKKVTNYWDQAEELLVWNWVKRLLESPIPKVFQNGLYDLQYLLKMSIRPGNCQDDTMLLWHSLYPESPKGLGFLGSVLTDEVSWKEMRKQKSDTQKRDE